MTTEGKKGAEGKKGEGPKKDEAPKEPPPAAQAMVQACSAVVQGGKGEAVLKLYDLAPRPRPAPDRPRPRPCPAPRRDSPGGRRRTFQLLLTPAPPSPTSREEIVKATSTEAGFHLKWLLPETDALVAVHAGLAAGSAEAQALADALSLLLSASDKDSARQALKFRLQGTGADLSKWGFEYIRCLSSQLAGAYAAAEEGGEEAEAVPEGSVGLIDELCGFYMTSNREPDAVDLLLETGQLDRLVAFIDDKNCSRACAYLVRCSSYLPPPDDQTALEAAYAAYRKSANFCSAVTVAVKVGSADRVKELFTACEDLLVQKQMALIIGRESFLPEEVSEFLEELDDESLLEAASNVKLTDFFKALGQDLDVMEAREPEDVFKNSLTGTASARLDSARNMLAATVVNGLLNAGFGSDKHLCTTAEEGQESNNWIFKNKEHGKISATASLGMVMMWDIDGGLPQVDKYLYSKDDQVLAGALLAVGIINSGVRNECDPAIALLEGHLSGGSQTVQACAVLGLGIAYCGHVSSAVKEMLVAKLNEEDLDSDVLCITTLALGLVCMGTADDDIVQAILQILMAQTEESRLLDSPLALFLVLGLGLIFLQLQDKVDAVMELSRAFPKDLGKVCPVILKACAFSGTGNVLAIQELLGMCVEHQTAQEKAEQEEDKGGDSPSHTANSIYLAVIGIATIAGTEKIGAEMARRTFDHLLQYGNLEARKAVPLALALLGPSDPDMNVLDTLSRLSHDVNGEVAINAVLAIGLVGAGTNNARVAGILRNLSSYYSKEQSILFVVRLAQGLLHMGKGLLTISPLSAHQTITGKRALGSLLALSVLGMNLKGLLVGKFTHLLYLMVPALKPRMFMAVDEDLKPVPVSCRVGQAIDTAGQVGNPKTISGFQTHTTPVLLSAGDKAEVATETHEGLSPFLEGVVIVKEVEAEK